MSKENKYEIYLDECVTKKRKITKTKIIIIGNTTTRDHYLDEFFRQDNKTPGFQMRKWDNHVRRRK